nr:uncharacterized protein LOC127333781 [Lolium perenne]
MWVDVRPTTSLGPARAASTRPLLRRSTAPPSPKTPPLGPTSPARTAAQHTVARAQSHAAACALPLPGPSRAARARLHKPHSTPARPQLLAYILAASAPPCRPRSSKPCARPKPMPINHAVRALSPLAPAATRTTTKPRSSTRASSCSP